MEWFRVLIDHLPTDPECCIWTDGDEILCRSEEYANVIADLIEKLYDDSGEGVVAVTGSYDEIDERDGVVDDYTGCWYIYLD